jgi:hypothetical protein
MLWFENYVLAIHVSSIMKYIDIDSTFLFGLYHHRRKLAE